MPVNSAEKSLSVTGKCLLYWGRGGWLLPAVPDCTAWSGVMKRRMLCPSTQAANESKEEYKMIRILRNPFCLLTFVAMLVNACVSTQLTSVWKDPAYQTRPAKIMVVGVARNPINRRLFEDEFVRQLKSRGTDAIASYTVIPDKQQGDQEAIAQKVKELGADTILITRLVSKKTVQVYVPGTAYYPPPYDGRWPDYYGYGYRYMYTPGYIAEDQYAVIETNLYEAKSDKLIWAASSETGIGDSNQNLIQSYISVMVNNMIGLGLLGK
jgi:hypothetical protein